MLSFTLNKSPVTVDIDPDTPLLWVLREQLGLCGTKFGCGVGQCGACTVHLDGQPTRSCITVVAGVEGRSVTTIEGLAHPVQQAWIDEQVPQCGYCQSGQIMVAAAPACAIGSHQPRTLPLPAVSCWLPICEG